MKMLNKSNVATDSGFPAESSTSGTCATEWCGYQTVVSAPPTGSRRFQNSKTRTLIHTSGLIKNKEVIMICNEIQPIPEDWDKRPIIRQYNADNELVVRTYGQTEEELLQDHLNGKCGAFCGHCYHEAMLVAKEDGTLCPNCPDYQTPVCDSCPYAPEPTPTCKEKTMDCHECPDYGTPECAVCGYPDEKFPPKTEVEEVDDDGAEWYYRMPLEDNGNGILFPNPDDEDIPF